MDEIVEQIQGPVRYDLVPFVVGGSIRITIKQPIRGRAGLDPNEDDQPTLPTYWFEDQELIVMDCSGVRDDDE